MAAPITITKSLANELRSELEPWLEDVEKQAKNLCPQHDSTGALSLVVPDHAWQLIPGNITNLAQVTAGTPPPTYRVLLIILIATFVHQLTQLVLGRTSINILLVK